MNLFIENIVRFINVDSTHSQTECLHLRSEKKRELNTVIIFQSN